MSETLESRLPQARLRSPERRQTVLRVECPDDLIGEDHPAREIWEITGRLDLAQFFSEVKAVEGQAGRDATDPRLLVALWLYATTEGVGSARELDRLCREHRAYEWLCGGVSVNYHMLSDFRVGHGEALDGLLTQLIVALVQHDLVKVWRISQDGTRVRACAGAGSYRRREGLRGLQKDARQHVRRLRRQFEDPAQQAVVSARIKGARERAAREREERVTRALALLPELERRQERLAKKIAAAERAGRLREPRVSTTDPEVRVMKMSDGGFRPAVNVQIASDTESRAILGIDVVSQGVDTGLSEPMREQVEARTGRAVRQHLVDGGYLNLSEIERATAQGVDVYVPAKPPRKKGGRGDRHAPKQGDTPELAAWRERMRSEEGQEIYALRASTSETINADLKQNRGLDKLTVRGLGKIRCVALWAALSYNLVHFGRHWIT